MPHAARACRWVGTAAELALVSLLALNGLRVFEATGADIEALGTERGHRTLAITRQGGKKAVIPLAPRTARAIDLAICERCEGPIFLTPAGHRLDRHGAGRIVRHVARRAGLAKTIGPRTLRHAIITAAPDAGVPLRDVQEAASPADPRTTMRYDRARVSLDRQMPLTSSRPSSPEPPGNSKIRRRTPPGGPGAARRSATFIALRNRRRSADRTSRARHASMPTGCGVERRLPERGILCCRLGWRGFSAPGGAGGGKHDADRSGRGPDRGGPPGERYAEAARARPTAPLPARCMACRAATSSVRRRR